MTKPIHEVVLTDYEGRTARVRAVFDTGSFRTIVQEGALPSDTVIVTRKTPETLRTSAQGGTLTIIGATVLTMMIGDRMIEGDVLVSPDLAQQMIVGSGTMQSWDISIQNENGRTGIIVGHDLRDPDIREVD